MHEKHRVEYMLEGVDHIPVTLDHDTKEKAVEEVKRIIQYPDLDYLQYRRIK